MAQIVDEASAAEAIAELKKSGKVVVMHTGCYEVIHAGHLACFTAGKNFKFQDKETALVVGVESDSTLRLNRINKDRPLFKQAERCEAIANVAAVDLVIRLNPNMAIEYETGVLTFMLRLQALAPDVFIISYNDSLEFFHNLMLAQTQMCAAAGVLILPVAHHIRTHATDTLDVVTRKKLPTPEQMAVLWQSKADLGRSK